MRERELEREFKRAKTGRGENSRLCGDLSRLKAHIKSCKHALKHPKACKVCGEDAYSMCVKCGVYLYFNPAKGKNKGKNCFHDYHDDCLFGLVRSDNRIGGFKKSEWTYPLHAKTKQNMKNLEKFCN